MQTKVLPFASAAIALSSFGVSLSQQQKEIGKGRTYGVTFLFLMDT